MINSDEELALEYLLSPEFEMINSAGKPLTDGWIEVYIHGTRNKYYCYSDWNGTLHPFKIPLDSLGSNIVLADPNLAFDVYVYNKFGSLIMSRYNVKCQGGGGTSTVEYLGDRLEYGQYTARDVTTVARLLRQKGNINTTQDGFLKLKEDMSYHITVRGTFVCDHLDNVATSLNYIEYSSFNPIKVNIDETVSGEQHFELSYDIFRLPNDMDYQVGFDASNGHISRLAVEVHSLSNLNTTLQGGGLFEQGWGIIIDNNVISVDPSIFEEYPTFDDLQAAVTAVYETVTNETLELVSSVSSVLQDEIDNIQQGVQSDWEQDDPSEPDYIKNKPDLSEFATHDEVVSAVSSVSSTLQNEIDELPRPVNADWDATSGLAEILNKPDLDIYATKGEVSTATSTIENEISEVINTVCAVSSVLQEEIDNIPEQVQADWEQDDDTQKDYIKNKPDLDVYATKSDVTAVSSVLDNKIDTVETEIINTVCAVSSVLQEEIDNIPEQVQSDWDESDTESPAYIQNKPDLDIYTTHDEVSGVSAVLKEIIDEVSAAVPDAQVQSDWTETDDTKKSYIQHKPEVKDVYAGENIILTDTASGLEISAVGTDTETVSAIAKGYADAVSAAIPEAQVQSDWTETDNTKKSYIQHKPTPKTLVAGEGINITDTVTGVEISSTGGGGSTYTAGTGIDITNDVISVSGVAMASDIPEEINLVAGQNVSIAVTGASAIINASVTGGGGGTTYTAGDYIDITDDTISVTGLDNSNIFWATVNSTTYQEVLDAYNAGKRIFAVTSGKSILPLAEYYTSRFYFSSTVRRAGISGTSPSYIAYTLYDSNSWVERSGELQANWNETSTSSASYIRNKPDLSTYATVASVTAVADSIPEIELNGNDQVTAIDGHALIVGSSYTPGTGIDITNDVISVNADVALASAVSGFATKSEVTTGLNGKQNTLTGITDVQVVQSLPASPVATVLYLIPEA